MSDSWFTCTFKHVNMSGSLERADNVEKLPPLGPDGGFQQLRFPLHRKMLVLVVGTPQGTPPNAPNPW